MLTTPSTARGFIFFAFALIASLTCNSKLFADSFSISYIRGATPYNFADGDNFGDWTIYALSPTCSPNSVCFRTHLVDGSPDTFSETKPTLPGGPDIIGDQPCSVTAPGFFVYKMLCNNGHIIFNGMYTSPAGIETYGI